MGKSISGNDNDAILRRREILLKALETPEKEITGYKKSSKNEELKKELMEIDNIINSHDISVMRNEALKRNLLEMDNEIHSIDEKTLNSKQDKFNDRHFIENYFFVTKKDKSGKEILYIIKVFHKDLQSMTEIYVAWGCIKKSLKEWFDNNNTKFDCPKILNKDDAEFVKKVHELFFAN